MIHMLRRAAFVVAALAFAAPFFVFAQSGGCVGVSGSGSTNIGGVNVSLGGSAGCGGSWLVNYFGLPQGSIFQIVQSLVFWLLAILGFLGILAFVISGIMYLTSAGDDKQIEKAKTAMVAAIIGIIVALIGFVIIKAVDAWLRGGIAF
jgi:hypothetical protein